MYVIEADASRCGPMPSDAADAVLDLKITELIARLELA